MFLQLTAPFSEGERVPVSLEFEKAGQINISLEVGGVGAKCRLWAPLPRGRAGRQAKLTRSSLTFTTRELWPMLQCRRDGRDL